MTVIELLTKLHELGVKLRVDGEHLRLNAPKGVISSSLKEEIAARKGDIIAFLRASSDDSPSIVKILPAPRERHLPLSYSQERLWFLDQLEPGNPAYNMPFAIHLQGTVNLPCLQQALNEILLRHEVLRTNFDVLEGQPVQIIAPPRPLPLSIIDLSHLPVEEQTTQVERLTEEEAKRPFNLQNDLLIRASLLKLNDDEHIFLLTMHHIVSDGWSIMVFSREFTSLYRAFINDQASPLAPLPVQYADFAQWQREWLQGERLEAQLKYWKQQLGGELPQLEILSDKPRPAVQSHNSGRASLTLSASLAQALRRLSQQGDATLFMSLLAAFKLLLHRQSGLEDIIVGSPIAGRNRAETENLIGFFLNTLVLRTDISGNPTFRELIQRVKSVAMDAYTHQDIPFEKLLIELQPERDLSRTPFFQVFFNMLNFEASGQQQLPGLTAELIGATDIGSKFDLTLYLSERSQGILLTAVYNADLFTSERIHSLLSQFDHLLSQIVADPDKHLDMYSLVPANTKTVLPDPLLTLDETWHGAVHSQFSKNAIQFPNLVALVDRSGRWTYQELEHRTNQLAHFLLAQGLEPHRIVALYGYRNISLVWAILGILKAGGAFLILDPAYPEARLLDYLNIANPQGFIQLEAAGPLPSSLESWAGNLGTCKITLPDGPSSRHFKVLDTYPISNPDVPIGPDDLACISFTSGSTGKPKAVMGRHGPLSHFIPWQREIFDLSPADHFSMLSGLSHDPLQRDIFTALWVGASVHIPEPENIGTLGWLNEWMYQEQITFSHFTPAMAQLLAGSTLEEDRAGRKLPALRYAFFVGDKLTRHDVRQLGQLAPNVICINSYGSTETQRAVGYLLVDPKDFSEDGADRPEGKAVIPVGQGMKDAQLLVLTSTQQMAGIGELGEIYVRSPHLAKGYLGDESLTCERFITSPFTKDSEDRLYRSGDLGRFLPDGKVEFLGRKDKQVKIRGFRIELGEIETILSKHPAVHQTVVTTWEPVSEDKRLVAYVVPTNQDNQKSVELREFLQERLPAHMIPSNFVFLNAIPITPNGKINHNELPPPTLDQREKGNFQVSARDNTEGELVKIWEELLHVHPIGVKDNFFELGGHSLLAVHLFSHIKKKFDVNLPLATLFQEATIEHLAKIISHKVRPITWSSLIGIETQGHHPPFFCIHGITGDILWFRDLAQYLAPDYPFYGLQARGLDGVQEPFSRIDEMAKYYIEEIRRCQPSGPYYLGGASFGGTVAFEIAQQLLNQGEQIALFAVFDHSPPNIKIDLDRRKFKNRLIMVGRMIRNFPYWLKEFLQLGPSRILMRIRRKMRLAKKARGQIAIGNLEQFEASDIIDFATELPSYRQQLITSHYHAMKMYVPQSYPGHVTLFRAKSRPLLNTFDPEVSWQKLAPGRVNVVDIPSSHEGMFREPNVYHLAKELKNCMDQVSDQIQHAGASGIQNVLSANLLYFLSSILLTTLII